MMADDRQHVLIVIVNYRTARLTIECLASLESEVAATPGSSVVVTDNASGDGSIDVIAAAIRDHGWASWASVMPLATNGGFAFGNNAAIRPALAAAPPPDFVWLLNPDTVARHGALAELVALLRAKSDVGIVGGRLINPDGSPRRAAFRFPSVLSELENGLSLGVVSRVLRRWIVAPPAPEHACPVDWVSGASMMVRREVFDAIGLMDEEYFLYFEETDFCWRAHKAGWAIWHEPKSRVVHLVGQATGVTRPDPNRRRPQYWFDSRKRYFRLHFGRTRALIASLAWSGGFAIRRVIQVFQRRPDPYPRLLLWDFVWYNFLPKWRRRR